MFKSAIRNQQGLTIIEMIVSLILIILVGIVSFQVVYAMQKNYERTQAFSQVINEGSIGTCRIAADIRSAIKPNGDTNAVRVISADQLDVYTFAAPSSYRQIRYQLVIPAGESYGELRRTEYSTSTPPSGANPMYSDCISTNTVLRGLVYNAASSPPIFEDKSPGSDDRRKIAITLTLRDRVNAKPMIPDQTINQIYTTRSQELGSP